MLVICNFIVFVIGTILFVDSLKKIIQGNRSICLITLLLFVFEYVFPLIIESIWYVLQIKFKMFPAMDYALCDTTVGFIYLMMCITMLSILYKIGINTNISLSDFLIPELNPYLIFLLKFLRFLPVFAVLVSPDPTIYIKYYAPAVFHRNELSLDSINFHNSILHSCISISFISTMLIQLFTNNEERQEKFYQYIAIIAYSFLNGKRTILAFSIMGFIAIDVLKSKEINLKKYFLQLLAVFVFFVLYSLLSGKGDYYGSSRMNLLMNYILYFDRAFITKVSIFNKIHPDLVHILDYPGQSILFNLFFWVPRTLWPGKPYPYSVYFTSGAVGNLSFSMVPWRFQTAAYSEWISNFGFFGFVIYIFLYFYFVKKTEQSGNLLIYFLGLIFSLYLQMFEYSGNQEYFIMWILLMIFQSVNKVYSELHRYE